MRHSVILAVSFPLFVWAQPLPTCQTDADCSTPCLIVPCDLTEGCVGFLAEPVNCDDGNECTLDGCDSSTGCTHQQVAGCVPCHTSANGHVLFGSLNCDDGDPCTDDT